LALAEALKVNATITGINLRENEIGLEGALALAEALKVNATITDINLRENEIGPERALALADALQVNTSLTRLDLDDDGLDESHIARVDALTARNTRFRQLLLFDARQMLMSRLCSDEFGVLWSYFVADADVDDGAAANDIESIRVELPAVVTERCRRELCRPVLVSDVCKLQRETRNQIAEQSNQLGKQISEQANQFAEQIAAQTNQIADLKNIIAEQNQQNQQVQDQIRQMHALLISREQDPSADVDERDKRAIKRRRTGR
jgi:hypothetical protein